MRARTSRDSCGRASAVEPSGVRDYDGVETSVVLSSTGLAEAAFASGVSGLGVSVPVLGDPALQLIGLSDVPAGETGLLP